MADSNVVVLDRGDDTTCTVSLFGATVISWKITKEEMLFVSKKAVMDGSKPIRGGVPIVFPKFGPWDPPDADGPDHGFARTTTWILEKEPTKQDEGDIEAKFSMTDDSKTRALWDFKFKLTLTIVLRKRQLQFDFDVENLSKEVPLEFNLLTHTYLRVPNVSKCEISGLTGCVYLDKTQEKPANAREKREMVTIEGVTDRIYQKTPDEHIVNNVMGGMKMKVAKVKMPDTVLWNPWSTGAQKMEDMALEEYPYMLCVEAGCVMTPVKVEPKCEWSAGTLLQFMCFKGCK